jgi:osmotically inducible protein OsmC
LRDIDYLQQSIKLNQIHMKRTASAHWEGDLKAGKGTVSTQSTVLDKSQYSFGTRFENGKGTNPEELLGAAHAGCFTMAVSAALGQAGFTPTALDTVATITLENLTVTGSHLEIKGKVPGISKEKFEEIVKGAEQNCVISRALSVAITSTATLAN